MEFENRTKETYFLLAVLSDSDWLNIVLFLLFLSIYLVTLFANFLLIIVRILDPHLHTPMYFFLTHLSIIDIIFTTTVAPKMLVNFLSRDKSISFLACALQMCISLSMGATECLLLAIMAYDRHVAICKPLHYHALMSRKICAILSSSCWIWSFLFSFIHTVLTFLLSFCKSREIQHLFCEIQPLLRLSCTDTRAREMFLFVASATIVLCSFLLTFFSYIPILSTILKIQSSEGKSKVFSTCSSHLLVVIIFYGTIMSIYMRPISSFAPQRDNIISLLYTTVTPMCNPLIYSIRNKEVKAAISKIMGSIRCTAKIRHISKHSFIQSLISHLYILLNIAKK